MRTVEGVYRDGRVELRHYPHGEDNTRVLVTFTGEPATAGDAAPAPGATAFMSDNGIRQPLPEGPERDAMIADLLAEMDAGVDFGSGPHPTREEIYNDRVDELDRRRRENR